MMMVEPQIMRRTTSMSGGMSVEVMAESDDRDVNVMRAMHMGGEGEGEGEKSHISSRSPTTCKAIDTTPHFLRTCCLCKCHLAPARDIYMYRGDTAFCSLECREEHMKVEERKDKCKVPSNSNYKKQDHHASSSNSNPNSKPSTSTIAAA